jgi:hypothetical protein
MRSRSSADVKRELESERERLGDAAQTLRKQSGSVAKRVTLTALGAVAVILAARAVGTRVFRRKDSGKDKGARLPFLDRD